jgi:hypothetical protein
MTAPAGSQFAFIQGANDSYFSQTLTLDPGNYAITFSATLGAVDNQIIQITVDGNPLSDIPITSAYPTFDLYRTNSFNVATRGTHVIKFAGAVSGDNKAFIDQIYLANANSAYIENPGFEAQQISVNIAGGTNGGWTFDGNSGVQVNPGGWWPIVPSEGNQAAWMQFNGTITRKVYIPDGTFNIGLYARRLDAAGVQNVKVILDGVQIGADIATTDVFAKYLTTDFTITAGLHMLSIAGTSLDNATAFIDMVSIENPTNTSIQKADKKLNAISLYPNPVQEVLNIKADVNLTSIEIFSLNGSLVSKTKSNDKEDTILLKGLMRGTYLIKVTDVNGRTQNKIFIKD